MARRFVFMLALAAGCALPSLPVLRVGDEPAPVLPSMPALVAPTAEPTGARSAEPAPEPLLDAWESDHDERSRYAAGQEARRAFLRAAYTRLRAREADLTYVVGPDFNALHHNHFLLDRGGWAFWGR